MRDLILKGPWTDDPSRKEYVDHIIDSTVAFVINMFPTSNPGRLDVLAKMYAVLFMHDGRFVHWLRMSLTAYRFG